MEIKVVRQIMEWNENCHQELRKTFEENNILMINIMGSPGAGKTTFITNIINNLSNEYKIGIIEGDIAGSIDAEKIAALGIPVVQLNTEGACHIEAMSIKNILQYFDLGNLDIMIVENIGNLVCPAEFDIGDELKVALLSIPEGDDKVEKYPLMFARANALVMTKYDMVKYFKFDENRVIENSKNNNSDIEIFKVDSVNGDGMPEFIEWLKNYINREK